MPHKGKWCDSEPGGHTKLNIKPAREGLSGILGSKGTILFISRQQGLFLGLISDISAIKGNFDKKF